MVQFFWTVLDVHKQGFLCFETIDLFLRDIVEKSICEDRDEHEEGQEGHKDRNKSIQQLRVSIEGLCFTVPLRLIEAF